MKTSFVIIVLNGMPFIEFSLKAVYPYAHEVIIVEGAIELARFAANEDGSSKDGTVEFIKSFPDPDNKIKLIQGIWPEKCEMQDEALKHATGDWIWLVDSDEVYHKSDFEKIADLVDNDPSVFRVNFFNYMFWKSSFEWNFDAPEFRTDAWSKRRLFRFAPGARFVSHRPPQIEYPEGIIPGTRLVTGAETVEMGIRFCHYSYVFECQMRQRMTLFHNFGWGKCWGVDLGEWYDDCFLKWTPENREEMDARYPICPVFEDSYTLPFEGEHPEVIQDFIGQVRRGETDYV
jgi:glycosyltransferase involved in cell wall biosynthesis